MTRFFELCGFLLNCFFRLTWFLEPIGLLGLLGLLELLELLEYLGLFGVLDSFLLNSLGFLMVFLADGLLLLRGLFVQNALQ